MGLTFAVTTITAVACFLAAAVLVVVVIYAIAKSIDFVQRRRPSDPLDDVDAEYQAARRAMNNAANQSWRNLID